MLFPQTASVWMTVKGFYKEKRLNEFIPPVFGSKFGRRFYPGLLFGRQECLNISLNSTGG